MHTCKCKYETNYATPFQCFCKPASEAIAASGDTLQTDDMNINIVEMKENEPEGW